MISDSTSVLEQEVSTDGSAPFAGFAVSSFGGD